MCSISKSDLFLGNGSPSELRLEDDEADEVDEAGEATDIVASGEVAVGMEGTI